MLIETIPAAFEMDEILYELRDHASGLNAGRWDYLFSIIKYFRDAGPDFVLPDRADVTMTAPFMRAYTELLVQTCHKRGAFAMGGMAAFIPNRRDPEVNEAAFAKVQRRQDAARPATASTARGSRTPTSSRSADEVFDARARRPAQPARPAAPRGVEVTAAELLDVKASAGRRITEAGLRNNRRRRRCATSRLARRATARWPSTT